MHPSIDDKESFVWISKNNNLERISYSRVVKKIQDLSKKAGITKPVNPHTFRHARATHLATKLTEAQMKEYFGWLQSSKMASVYVHLSGRDVDDAILKMHGILTKDEEKKEEEIEIKECMFCHERNSFNSKYCRRCGTSLDPKIAMETISTPEKLDERIKKIVGEILAQKD